MESKSRALKAAAYLPIHPRSLKLLIGFLRFIHCVPASRSICEQIRSILVIQPHDSLGDLVLSIPFLDEVHRQWPNAEIDVVVGRKMMPLFRNIPYIRSVIGYTPSRKNPPIARYSDTLGLLQLRRKSLAESYDLALDPRWDSDGYAYLARALAFMSGASRRASYSGQVDGHGPSLDGFMTQVANGGHNEHELIRKLRLFQRAGLAPVSVEESASRQVNTTIRTIAEQGRQTANWLFESLQLDPNQPYGIVAPSATAPKRMWPAELFSSVLRPLFARYGLRFLVIGTSAEAGLCAQLADQTPEIATSIAGKTSVIEMCGILANAALFIGNDSGPAHISGILGVNTIAVSPFPLSSNGLDHVNAPSRFRPCGPRVRIVQPAQPLNPCSPACVQKTPHCITQVSVDTVLTVCDEMLGTGELAIQKSCFPREI